MSVILDKMYWLSLLKYSGNKTDNIITYNITLQ